METFARFVLDHVIWFILPPATGLMPSLIMTFLLFVAGPDPDGTVARERRIRLGCCALDFSILLLPLIALICYLYAAWGWWPALERTLPPFDVTIGASPVAGTFREGELVTLELTILNRSPIDVREVELSIPFSSALVVDYLNATTPLEKSGAGRYRAFLEVRAGETRAFSVPIQVTTVGEHSGQLEATAYALLPLDIEPVGGFGDQDDLTRSDREELPLTWIVLRGE